jgi:4-hydroxythreonine-4-phosphate dehydrogenase
MKEKIRIGITHGDFNGINYEIIMKTFADTAMNEFFVPIVYGSPKVAAYYRKALNMENFNFNLINDANDANTKKTNIINVADNVKVEIGVSSQLAGIASIKALDRAVEDLQNGKIDAIVTCPVNRAAVDSELYNFVGHTEYFADKFAAEDYMLLMVNELMRVGFVTGYIPLEDVPKTITRELIGKRLAMLNESLKNDFLIRAPRIAVLSLNPRRVDDDSQGKEETELICPVIEEAKRNGILAFGAYPADAFFAFGEFARFDAVLAMYHDQGMTPFKSIGLSGGVCYTAGLPIVGIYPDHGIRYDIAGKGIASPESLRDALFLAVEIFTNRKTQDEVNANPLKIRTNHQKRMLE